MINRQNVVYLTVYFTSPLYWRPCQIKFYSKWLKNVTIFLVLVTHGNTKNAKIILEKKLKSSRPNAHGWWFTILFKEEGNRCSILRRLVISCTILLRNILWVLLEPPQRCHHIQLMELSISPTCWLSDKVTNIISFRNRMLFSTEFFFQFPLQLIFGFYSILIDLH